MPENLVSEALRRALVVRRPSAGLVVHSGQGSSYKAARIRPPALKPLLLDGGYFPGLAEATPEISHHIAYYNAERRHSALGYCSPNHFETHLKTTSQFCPA